MELIGRERELALLRRAGSGLVVVEGEPGIGKSSLLAALRAGRDALRGAATEFETGVPFALFADAFSTLGAERVRRLSRGDGELAAMLAGAFVPGLGGERYRLFQAVGSLLERLADAGEPLLVLDDAHWADSASIELIAHLARRPPSLPVVLGLRPGQAPEGLVRALRGCRRITLGPLAREDAEALLSRVPSLRRDAVYERSGGNPFFLDALARREAERVPRRRASASHTAVSAPGVSATPGAAGAHLASVAHGAAGSAPGVSAAGAAHLASVAHGAAGSAPGVSATSGAANPAPVQLGDGGGVPREVLDALSDELAALSPDALAFARGGAVAADPFAPELAAAAAEQSEAAALAALDELVAAEVVAEAGTPRQFRFRHPIVRQAIYAQAGPGWKLGAHARVAAVLARQGAAPARRAHHLEQCAQPGDREAIAVLRQAASDAAPRAPAAAAQWWAAALRLLPAEAAEEERLGLLVPMATSLGAAGELAAGRDALTEILALVDQPELRGRLVAFIAMLEQLLGHRETAHALLAGTLAEQPDPGSPAATALQLELAKARYFVADWDGMRAHAADALAAARALGDEGLIAGAAGTLALAEYHVSDVAAARVLLDEAAARLDALGDDVLAGSLDAALLIGWAEQCLARWDDVHRHYERALAVGRATGQGYLLVPMTIGRAIAHAWQGRLTAAAELADEAIEAAQLSGNDQSLTWALTLRTWVATLSGDLELALAVGADAVEIAAGLADTHWGGLSGCYLAEARLEAGEDARADLLQAAGGPDLPLIERAFKPQWYEILTRAELAAVGRGAAAPPASRATLSPAAPLAASVAAPLAASLAAPLAASSASPPRPAAGLEAAEAWALAAQRAASGLDLPARTGQAQRARAAVLLAQGQAARAAETARAAARHSHQAGNVLDAARSHLLAGQALAAAGRPREATVALTAALGHEQARRLHDHAALELRRLGRRVARQGRRAPRPESGVGALTDREREIAALIAAGHTNRRIAAQLHLSPKTVETHVAHIFAKLGVRSRAAAAAAVSAVSQAPG